MEYTNEQIELIKSAYKETFGREPSKTAKLNITIKKLEKEGVDMSQILSEDQKASIEKPEPAPQPEPEPEIYQDQKLSQGRGNETQYLVHFRGSPRYWTASVIRSMRSYSKEIKFPEGSPYPGLHDFETCKTC